MPELESRRRRVERNRFVSFFSTSLASSYLPLSFLPFTDASPSSLPPFFPPPSPSPAFLLHHLTGGYHRRRRYRTRGGRQGRGGREATSRERVRSFGAVVGSRWLDRDEVEVWTIGLGYIRTLDDYYYTTQSFCLPIGAEGRREEKRGRRVRVEGETRGFFRTRGE